MHSCMVTLHCEKFQTLHPQTPDGHVQASRAPGQDDRNDKWVATSIQAQVTNPPPAVRLLLPPLLHAKTELHDHLQSHFPQLARSPCWTCLLMFYTLVMGFKEVYHPRPWANWKPTC